MPPRTAGAAQSVARPDPVHVVVGFKSMPSLSSSSRIGVGYDIALYDIGVDNDIVPYNGGPYYLTAATARRQGAEAGVSVQSIAGLFANGAFTLSHTTYRTTSSIRWRGGVRAGDDESFCHLVVTRL